MILDTKTMVRAIILGTAILSIWAAFGLNDANAALIGKPPSNLGLVGYWSMNEGTGSYAGDSSGNKNQGTLTNGPSWVTGKRGGALNFDGGGDYVKVSDPGTNSVLDFGSGKSITITAWVDSRSTTTAGAYSYIVSKGRTLTDTATNQNYGLRLNDVSATTADVNFIYRNSGDTAWNRWASTAVITKKSGWHHVVFIYTFGTSGSATAYIDGVSSGGTWNLGTGTDVPLQDNDALWIGSSLATIAGANFYGLIDEVRIYNRALSAAEVQALYKSGAAKLVQTVITKPITAKLLTSGSGGGVNSDTTASFTPSANALVLAFVYTLANVAQVPTMTGNGLTWVRIFGPVDYDSNGTISAFRAMGAAPSSGAATISYSVTSSSGRWVIIEFANVDTSGTNGSGAIVQTATNVNYGGSSVTATLAAFSNANNATVGGAFLNAAPRTTTVGSGFSLLGSVSANAGQVDVEWKSANDTTVDMSWGNTGNQYMWAAEIKAKPKSSSINSSQNSKLTNGLVGLWSFNGPDMSGNTAYDRSWQGNNGTLTNGPALAAGKVGQALNFDGVDDYVNVGNANASLRFTGNGSISAWVKLNPNWSSGGQIFKRQGDGGGFYEWGMTLYLATARTIGFSIVHTDGTPHQHDSATVSTLNTNQWYHLVGVWDSPVLRIYINGVQDVATTIDAGTLRTGTNRSSCIGVADCGGSASGYFNGLIDEVRVYNRVLTPDEIKRLYNMGR